MDTLRLTLLRHAHAQPLEEAAADFVRQLSARGRAQATQAGAKIAQADLVPDLILASSAQRTQTTAQLLAAAASVPKVRIQYVDELYNASAHRIWNVATTRGATWRAGKARHVLVCGHNPGISRLAGHLGKHPAALDLPPAGLITALWESKDPQHWDSLLAADATEVRYLSANGAQT